MREFTIQGSDGQKYGPVDADTLIAWAAGARVGPATLVYDHEAEKWVEAKTFAFLKSAWLGGVAVVSKIDRI